MDEAVASLRRIGSDAVVEDVWDALDFYRDEVQPRVEAMLDEPLGEYPRHCTVLWLAYTAGNQGRIASDAVLTRVRESIVWAMRFEENQVLIGGALGALESVPEPRRNELALDVFEALGSESSRRYWLMMKVKTDALMTAVIEALEDFDESQRAKMAGAFRQFGPADAELLLRHFRPDSPAADLLVEALGATRSQEVRPALEEVADDPRDAVRGAAARALATLEA